MKNIKKIILLFLALTISLSTVVGVYAWFTLRPTSEALDLNARSTELVTSSSRFTLGSTSIDFNHPLYNKTEYAVELTRAQIISNLSDSTFPMDINVIITALKNVNVRFKIVEVWTVSNVVQNRPNVFTWNYALSNRVDNAGYYMHPDTLLKSTTPHSIDFVDNATVNTTVLNSLSTSAVLRLSIVVSAVQSNRASNWNLTTSNHVVKTLNLPSNITNHQLNVVFNGVSNPQYTRGVYVEFTSGSNNFSYIWHTRSTLASRLAMPAGTYNVRINLVNHLDFTVVRSGSGNNSVITVTISYGTIPSWGFEDVLYAPSMVPNWQPNVSYSTGDVVFYDDAKDEGVNAGYYRARQGSTNAIPDEAAWAWEVISILYSDTRVYQAGEIIYYNNRFWRAKQQVWAGNQPPLSWAWELLGNEFELGNVFVSGDVTFVVNNDVKTWYVSFGSFTAFDATVQTHYALKLMGIDYNPHNHGKYAAGEYLRHNGYFWRTVSGGNWSAPALGNSAYTRLGVEYSNRTYPVNTVVLHNGQYYIALNAISTGQTPGVHANWRLINHRGNYNASTTYNRYDSVIFNGKRYFWNLAGTTTNTNPETITGWWSLDETWDFKNTYVQDSVVSYNGDLFVLRTGTSTNQTPGVTGAWQPLSLKWSPTGLYNRSGSNVSIVEHNGKTYVWYGAHASTNTGEPGTARNGWNEMTDVWVSSNRYLQGDFVIYDGSFWELIVAENPTDQRNVPGIDFTVWREHPILFDPNRN